MRISQFLSHSSDTYGPSRRSSANSHLVENEQPSEQEIREGEAQAAVSVQIFTAACAALWFCTSSPFLTFECRRWMGGVVQQKNLEKYLEDAQNFFGYEAEVQTS